MAAGVGIATRVVLLGFLSWLIPFAAGFLLFAVKKANAPLFSTLMYLVVLVTAGALLAWYFRKRAVSAGEAMLVGLVWLAINLVLDYPMFAFGPMKMTALAYYSEIGLAYLTFPLFGLLTGLLAKAQCEH
jgi:uncharacterized membrane protein YpjA